MPYDDVRCQPLIWGRVYASPKRPQPTWLAVQLTLSLNMKPYWPPDVPTGIRVSAYASTVRVAKTMFGFPKRTSKHQLISPGNQRRRQTRQTHNTAMTTT